MAELIKTTDSLNDGRKKLNDAITDSNAALSTANTAKQTANLAKAESESTQTQLDTIVIEGDSSVEAAQARVNNSGTAFPTLKQRLDAEHQEVTAQLQQTEQELSSQLAEKPNKGEIAVSDINKNLGKFDQTYMSDELLQQMAGNTPINTVPADKSITTPKIANIAVNVEHMAFTNATKNLFSKNNAKPNTAISNIGTEVVNADFHSSDYIPITPLKYYSRNLFSAPRLAFYDGNKTFISYTMNTNYFQAPANAYYLRANVGNNEVDNFILVEGLSPYLDKSRRKYEGFKTLDLSSVNLKEEPTENIFDDNCTIPGYVIGMGLPAATGTGQEYTEISEYIPIKPNSRYALFSFKIETGEVELLNQRRLITIDQNGNLIRFYQNGTSLDITTESNAAYVCFNVYNNWNNTNLPENERIYRHMLIEDYDGVYPTEFIPNKRISHRNVPLPPAYSQLSKADVLPNDWKKKVWVSYGDSITAIGGGIALDLGWQAYVNSYYGFIKHYGMGVGGQSFRWNTSTFYAKSDGTYHSRDSGGNPPEGTTEHMGSFCSWDRIKTMIPQSADMIYIMGGTNDMAQNVPLGSVEWSASNVLDSDWSADVTYYNSGDFDITTFKGAVASTIMKMQAWNPNAIIVLGTLLSGYGENSATDGSNMTSQDVNTLGLTTRDYADAMIEVAHYFSIPVIDVQGLTGINPFNRSIYISDGVHPYKEEGKKALARAVIGGLKNVIPNII